MHGLPMGLGNILMQIISEEYPRIYPQKNLGVLYGNCKSNRRPIDWTVEVATENKRWKNYSCYVHYLTAHAELMRQ